ncbi:MAG: hypothetical protein WC343_05595 [Bacilli bacterium]
MGFKAEGRSLSGYRIHTLLAADPICVFQDGIRMDAEDQFLTWENLAPLAERLGVEPPTGEGLRDRLLRGMFPKITNRGVDAQILRW